MGRGASEDMGFVPRPRPQLPSLTMILEEFAAGTTAEGGVGRDLADMMKRVRTLPVPVATEAGEELDVYGHKVSYCRTSLVWDLQVVGHSSGRDYGTTRFRFEGSDVRDIDLGFVALGLKMAMHHPADLDDSVYEAWCALTDSETSMSCSACGKGFVTWQEAADHEARAHGLDSTDRRPRIPRG